MKLELIRFSGPGKADAEVKLASGVNVICGASDTGKSFVINTVDFMLGGKGPLPDIPERVGYDAIHTYWRFGEGSEVTEIVRAMNGGDYSLIAGSEDVEDVVLKGKATGEKTNTLSAYFLDQLGLFPRKIKRNKKNEKNTLSIRDLARLTVVPDERIDKPNSPFLSGQVVNETADYSALRLFLTGVDDSALVQEKDAVRDSNLRTEGKLELLNSMIVRVEQDLEEQGLASEEEAATQFDRIESTLRRRRTLLTAKREEVSSVEETRRSAYIEASRRKRRIDEIDELFARFGLLDEHYENDLERLEAIQETGSYFIHLAEKQCPLCGAPPGSGHGDDECDGDIEIVVAAAKAEIEKIVGLRADLAKTREDLAAEQEDLSREHKAYVDEVDRCSRVLKGELSVNAVELQDAYQEALDARAAARNVLSKYDRLNELKAERDALAQAGAESHKQEITANTISKSVLDEFSQTVLRILQAWDFPEADRIHFDESARDFVIDGKPRGARGRGLRAITYAASTIGLLEFCQARHLPHPGFVAMDSPLLAYFEPEGDDDDLTGTDLERRFYQYLIERHSQNQILIVENTSPPRDLYADMKVQTFTKNPALGRYGLFPS
jgi:hypothetical protein